MGASILEAQDQNSSNHHLPLKRTVNRQGLEDAHGGHSRLISKDEDSLNARERDRADY